MANDQSPTDVKTRMEQLKTLEDARRLADDRAETVRLARCVQDTRHHWKRAKDRAALAKLEHELACLNLEHHAGVELDDEDLRRRNKARKQLLPGLSGDDEEKG